jgi:serine protease Do
MIDLVTSLADATSEVVRRVQRSLVVLHNGRHGIGAGIIWGRDGLILTNHHVAASGRHRAVLRAALPDGRELPVDVLAQDPEIDLALLRVEAQDLPAALVADSRDLRVGQYVLAIGHPWGQRGAVTGGLISGLSTAQTRGPRGSVEVIRSDVRLAPGNSGGPLVNAAGAVVGINTMIWGGDQGIAVPSHVASAFVEQALQSRVEGGPRRPAWSAGQPAWGRDQPRSGWSR